MKGDKKISKKLSDGSTASIKPYDDCCYLVEVKKNGEIIDSGVWCPQSKILASDGEIVCVYQTKEEVLKDIEPREIKYTKYL
jgi:hypothetical protein